MFGRILQVVTRYTGTSTVGIEASGQTVISIDSVRDFPMDTGFLVIENTVKAYTSVDRVNSTITLAVALSTTLPAGSNVYVYPQAQQRWAFVTPESMETAADAVWALIPHALSAFIAADGGRETTDQELVEYQRDGSSLIITDLKDKKPALQADAIPDGLITETKIEPGSITTPLLAANAVAAQNIQFGAATGDKLSSNALYGKTIIGPIIKTSADGPRVEMTPQGIKQFKDIGGQETETLSIGDQNRFTGEIDATAMIIRDQLQMFGKNNFMGAGSKMTLAAGSAASSTAPTLAWVYDSGPTANAGLFFPTGASSEPSAIKANYVAHFFSQAMMARSDGKYWNFPQVPHPNGGTYCEFKPQTMTRIALQSTGAERAVLIGEDYNRMSPGGYPEIWMRVYDDSTMNTSGTAAPLLKYEVKIRDFNWGHEWRLGRVVTGGARHWFTVTLSAANSGTRDVTVNTFTWNNNDAQADFNDYRTVNGVLAESEGLAGVVWGTRSALGLAGTGSEEVFVLMTTARNMTYAVSGSVYDALSDFPVTYNPQDRAWSEGSTVSNTHTAFVSQNWSRGDQLKTFRYANNHKLASGQILWASFIWRGEASKTFRTTMSTTASTVFRKLAKLRITMPALPAPIAGVGAARDPNNDIYGWEYFMGFGAGEPARTGFWLQTVQPSMVTNTPLAINSIDLSTYPVLSGTNPPASSTFPASSSGSIVNTAGTLSINGDGKITADEFLGGGIQKLWDLLMPIGTVIGSFVDEAPYRTIKLTGNPVAVSRTTYAALFAKIGTTFGAGNGSTTFNLPGVSGRSLIGVGSADSGSVGNVYSLGTKIGHEGLQQHNHPIQIKSTGSEAGGYGLVPSGSFTDRVMVSGSFINSDLTGNGNSANLHPIIGTHFFIRY